MKILILSDACFNDNIFPLYKAMLAKGLDVTCLINLSSLHSMLFNIDRRIPMQSIIPAEQYPEIRVYEKYVDLSHMYLINHDVDRRHFWRDLTSSLAVIDFIKKGKYDVIHTDMLFKRSQVFWYIYRKKIVNIIHDPFPHSGVKLTIENKIRKKLRYWLIKHFVILNKTHLDDFCQYYNLKKEQVSVNLLGPLDCIRIYSDDDIQQSSNMILFFGRIVKYKGIEYLCEAMKIVHSKIPDAHVIIAGAGNYYFDKREYEGLDYFEFINRFIDEKELACLLQKSTISICYYTDATQSGGVLTSFVFNKPVIASDIPTMREVIEDEYNGLLVPPKKPELLAEAIIRLLTDSDLKDKIINNVKYELYNGDNSWSRIVDKYVEIYHKVISE